MKSISTSFLILALAACSSTDTPPEVTQQDWQGNYVTTSAFQSNDRDEFHAALRSGLTDFDLRVADLRRRANQLGGEHLEEYGDWSKELTERRKAFVNQLHQSEAALVGDWPEQRQDTLECYNDMRNCLDEAYEEVLDT